MSAEIIAWLRSAEGEAWSRDRTRYQPSGPIPAMYREPGPVDQAWDPCGRLPLAATGDDAP